MDALWLSLVVLACVLTVVSNVWAVRQRGRRRQ
jgi:hypothetical protein